MSGRALMVGGTSRSGNYHLFLSRNLCLLQFARHPLQLRPFRSTDERSHGITLGSFAICRPTCISSANRSLLSCSGSRSITEITADVRPSSETIKRVLAFPPDTNIVWKSHDDSIAQRSAIEQARQEKATGGGGSKRRDTINEEQNAERPKSLAS